MVNIQIIQKSVTFASFYALNVLALSNDSDSTTVLPSAANIDSIGIEPAWYSIIPLVVALALALITKEVISSLMSGILLGSLIYVCVKGEFFLEILRLPFLILAESMGDGATTIMFCMLLGSLVYIMTAAGGTAAYGRWAIKAIHSKVGAQLATAVLGVIVFVDGYFSTIATGTVMKPVTDLNKISREKLAFIVDTTGAAVCSIIPISSWAAVIISAMEESELV